MASSESRQFTVSQEEQSQRLQLCDIDPRLYAGLVDPSAFTALAIQEAARVLAELPTGVHAGQRLTIERFPQIGEPMRLTCAVAAPQKVDRGALLRFTATLADDDGGSLIETTEDLVVPDPAAPPRSKAAASAPDVDLEVSTHGLVAFDPVRVARYCRPDVNPIHFDPAAAAAAGFRAPIIGGEQGVRHIMALIWRTLGPAKLDISLRFLRPLFWDDQCELMVEARDGRWMSVSLAKDGKKATEVTLHG